MIPATAGIPPKPAFFITASGQNMNESMISKRIDAVGKRLNPSLPGNLRSSRLRKGIITLQRSDKTTSISNQRLAQQMSHTVTTAHKYYNIEDDAQADVDVALYLSSLLQPKKTVQEVPSTEASPTFVSDHDVQTITSPPLSSVTRSQSPPPNQCPHALKTLALAVVTNIPLPTAPAPINVARPAKVNAPKRKPDVPPRPQEKEKSSTAPVSTLPKGKITFTEKCCSWINTGKIQDRARPGSLAATSSSGLRHYWTPLQGDTSYRSHQTPPFQLSDRNHL